MNTHELSAGQFDALASGLGGPVAIGVLRDAQLSKRLLLLTFVATYWPAPHDDRDTALAVLARIQRTSPESFLAMLGEPWAGAWLARSASPLRNGQPADPAALGQLAAMALASAHRAGLDVELRVPVVDEQVHLPTLGTVRLAVPANVAVPVRTRAGAIEALAGTDAQRWQPIRRLDAGGVHFVLDDLNPFRDVYHAPPCPRLDDMSLRRWTDRLRGAWSLLVRYSPHRASELATGLSTMVPLGTPASVAMSGTSPHQFGAFGTSLPDSDVDLAVTMVHEFQHSKMSALLDLYPLVAPDDGRRYFAPWRTDARPINALVQGVYAFLGVADVYSCFLADPSVRPLALSEFAYTREQVSAGLANLVNSGRLTELGERFAQGLHRTLNRLLAVSLPAGVPETARRRLAAARAAWRTSNRDSSNRDEPVNVSNG